MERWVGKVAVVTGASAGIGKAITENLVKNGLIVSKSTIYYSYNRNFNPIKVVGFARRKELIEKLAEDLSKEKGKLYAVQVDMTKEEDIKRAFQWTTDNVGVIHILINNAGTARPGTLLDGETTEWKTVLDLNVLGLCIATREATKIMREKKIDGHVVHINSVLGHYTTKAFNVYSATKFAVTALTDTLRQELNEIGSKIKITVR